MPYQRYTPTMKVIAVRMLLQGMSERDVHHRLGQYISSRSFRRWMGLFHETKAVIRDPEEYEQLGRRRVFNAEDHNFMSALINQEPHLFLDKIQDELYNNGGDMTSISTIDFELRKRLGLTLDQKAAVSSARKSFVAKAAFMKKYEHVPAEYLVFTGTSSIPSILRLVHIGSICSLIHGYLFGFLVR